MDPNLQRSDILQRMQEASAKLTEPERAHMRRTITGKADDDLLTRKAVIDVLREQMLATLSLPSEHRHIAQRAIQAAIRAVGLLPAGSTHATKASKI